MPCVYCSAQFNITRWKTKCQLCHQNHCSQCIVERKCRTCYNVTHTNFKRSHLMKLKVKELRLYLKNRSYPIETIKEKHELVKKIQSLEGVHEPEYQTYSQSYSSTRHTWAGPDDVMDLTNTSDDDDIEVIGVERTTNTDCSPAGPGFTPPPSYRQTQESFPTAREFQGPSTSTASTSSPQASHAEAANSSALAGDKSASSTSKNENASPVPKKGELLKLCEISSAEQIQDFSVRQLKYLLKDSLVDYRGILEKGELLKRALNLYDDHQKNQESIGETDVPSSAGTSAPKEENFCKICWENPVDCVFLECAHMVTCIVCSKAIRECPICREHIVRTVRVFKS